MSDITNAIKQICEEKGLSYQAVVETIESALAAAYRKDYGEKNQNIKVEFDPETGKSKVFDVKIVVKDVPSIDMTEVEKTNKIKEKVKTAGEQADQSKETEEKKFNPKTEIQLSDAKKIKKSAKIGQEIKTKLTVPEAYGRMAAQTAKQVIVQKLREAERDLIFNDFKNKEHEVIAGIVQRREGRTILVDLNKTIGFLPVEEQIARERYAPGDRIKVYVKQVGLTPKGPEIILSRTSEEILKKVFYLEIPEISNGLVEIKAIAREAGSRSKVAVAATNENVDPIGSCVGQRGSRIQTIISELGGEKIDIIEYDDNQAKFISNALSPAKVLHVEIDSREKKALIKVNEDQLSLAIGKDGQNVRLAARLTGWKLDITGNKDDEKVKTEKPEEKQKDKEKKTRKKKDIPATERDADQANLPLNTSAPEQITEPASLVQTVESEEKKETADESVPETLDNLDNKEVKAEKVIDDKNKK